MKEQPEIKDNGRKAPVASFWPPCERLGGSDVLYVQTVKTILGPFRGLLDFSRSGW